MLIELDPTMNEAERNHLRSDLTSAQLDVARLRAALSGRDDPVSEFRPPAAAPASLVAMQRQFLVSQTSEFAAKLAALDRQRARRPNAPPSRQQLPSSTPPFRYSKSG